MHGTGKAALDFLTTVAAAELAGLSPEELELLQARIRAGELQRPDEPAACIAWLASDAGARWTDVLVPWPDPRVREQIRRFAGFS
jgi:hypothetical protein